LHNDFHDLLTNQTDIQTGLDMNFQLRSTIAQRGEGGNRGDLSGANIQTRPGVDIAEREFN